MKVYLVTFFVLRFGVKYVQRGECLSCVIGCVHTGGMREFSMIGSPKRGKNEFAQHWVVYPPFLLAVGNIWCVLSVFKNHLKSSLCYKETSNQTPSKNNLVEDNVSVLKYNVMMMSAAWNRRKKARIKTYWYWYTQVCFWPYPYQSTTFSPHQSRGWCFEGEPLHPAVFSTLYFYRL